MTRLWTCQLFAGGRGGAENNEFSKPGSPGSDLNLGPQALDQRDIDSRCRIHLATKKIYCDLCLLSWAPEKIFY
jgi:hypothetical protein